MSDQKKSPRDWLLARHADTQPRLDAMRRAALRANAAMSDEFTHARLSLTWSGLFFELLRPNRGVWRVLAAIWLTLVLFQLTSIRPSTSSAQSEPSSKAFTAWLSQLKSHDALAQIDHRP